MEGHSVRIYENIGKDRLIVIAAGVTFYSLLAIFPAIAAQVAIYGLFADPSTIAGQVDALSGVIPEGAIHVLRLAGRSDRLHDVDLVIHGGDLDGRGVRR
jgi:uncharacterized BrkB/YihY/UPF0761 family membrane protein